MNVTTPHTRRGARQGSFAPGSGRSTAARVLALVLTIATGVGASALAGQSSPMDYRDEFLRQFEPSSYKIAELARVMPQEKYDWAPGEGVMPVAQVYMHLAAYNFMYLDENLGIAPPADIDYSGFEEITDKETVRELFDRSVEHVKTQVAAMTEADLTGETRLYGRTVAGWSVLLQLVAHMNEHVGQSVAYARMNDIKPPWSR